MTERLLSPSAKIYVAGHRGLVGSAIVRCLLAAGFSNLVTRSHAELDLADRSAVAAFFDAERPDYVFDAAARVGGIQANDRFPAEFIHDNIVIQANLIDAAYRADVKKFLFLGSSCIYPKFAPQPLREDYLLTGPLEPSNEWYAIAKISGIKLCQAYRKQYGFNAICLMPTNLYGPGDNFDPESSHVLPALIRKCHEAKVGEESFLEVWGTGKPKREFMYVDDLADACLLLMEVYNDPDIINVGTGTDLSIAELASMVKEIVGFPGDIHFDESRLDGTPRKRLDISKLSSIGWAYKTELRDGIEATYRWYLGNIGMNAGVDGKFE